MIQKILHLPTLHFHAVRIFLEDQADFRVPIKPQQAINLTGLRVRGLVELAKALQIGQWCAQAPIVVDYKIVILAQYVQTLSHLMQGEDSSLLWFRDLLLIRHTLTV
jgi:hypothetical protein